MSALSYYLIDIINKSDYEAEMEYIHGSDSNREMIDESAEELRMMIQAENQGA